MLVPIEAPPRPSRGPVELEPFEPDPNPSPVEVYSADRYTLLEEERERDCAD